MRAPGSPQPCPSLLEVLAEVGKEPEQAGRYQRILRSLIHATEAVWGEIRILEPSSGILRIRALAADDAVAEALRRLTVRSGDAPLGLAAERRVPVELDLGLWTVFPDCRLLSYPIQSGGVMYGCLSLAMPAAQPVENSLAGLLPAAASVLGLMAANAGLLRTARRRSECLSLLHQSCAEPEAVREVPGVTLLLLERLTRLLGLDEGAVYLSEGADGEERLAAAMGQWPRSLQLAAAEQELLSAGIPVLAQPGEVPMLERLGPPGGLLLTPLIARGTRLGLFLGRIHPDAQRAGTEPEDLQLALLVAEQGALAVAEARLWERREQALEQARAAEQRFRDLLESAPDAMLLVDEAGMIRIVNTQVEVLFGFDREELLGRAVEMLVPERHRAAHQGHRAAYGTDPRPRPMGSGRRLLGRRRDGSEFPVEISLSPLRLEGGAGTMAAIRDATRRCEQEAERERLLDSERHKSEQLLLLVREAHHRIKNNLQAVTDLLYLELATSGESDALRESMERVQAISLVHDLLTQDSDVRVVDARELVSRLVEMLEQSGGLGDHPVSIELAVEKLQVPSRRATTLALVLNELVSNAAKHAFRKLNPPGRRLLRVALIEEAEGAVLTVQDNGPGLPAGFAMERDTHVGLDLVRTLVTRDLSGSLELRSDGGVVAEVRFPREP